MEWLQDEQGGHRLLAAMDQPENFGEDKEEDLLSSLAKVTYHIRRDRTEGHRVFFNRWEEAMRRGGHTPSGPPRCLQRLPAHQRLEFG